MHGQKLAKCMALVTPQKALALIIGNVTCYYCSSGAVVIVVIVIITTAPGQQRSTVTRASCGFSALGNREPSEVLSTESSMAGLTRKLSLAEGV